MLFTEINPFISDISSDDVTSSVVNFTITNCDQVSSDDKNGSDASMHDRRRRRDLRASLVDTADMVEVSLNFPDVAPQYVNESTRDVYRMLYHTVNITEPIKPLLVTVHPVANESLTVYVDIGREPSPDNHTWVMNVTGDSDISLENSNCSLFISAEDLSNITQENATVNIGVQRKGNFSSIFTCRLFTISYLVFALKALWGGGSTCIYK